MKIELGKIALATIQIVGNKSNGEGVTFASSLNDMTESSDFIRTLVYNTFKFDDIRHFDFVGSLSLNPVYTFVSKIFEDNGCFIKECNNLARYLYDQSIHPNIKNGEFYIALFQDSLVDGIETDAILMLKSERKDAFLMITNEMGKIKTKPTIGLSLKQIDKGCIIFNTNKETGYSVFAVDNTNSGKDAHYWTDSFLHIIPYEDDYHNTKKIDGFCTGFARLMKKKMPEQNIGLIKALGNIAECFQKNNTISLQQLEEYMSFTCEARTCLAEYKRAFEKGKGALPISFQVNMGESNCASITRKQTLKIGKDFEVKILNPSAEIEKGYDSDREKSYYKFYFE